MLDHAKKSSLSEGEEVHEGGVFEKELMVDLDGRFGLEIDNVNLAFRNIEDDHLFVVHRDKKVDDVVVGAFPEYFSFVVEMN